MVGMHDAPAPRAPYTEPDDKASTFERDTNTLKEESKDQI